MQRDTLPIELMQKWGHLKFVKQQGANEFSAECVKCGDAGHYGSDYPDRFRIFTDGKARAWCRRCGHFEWADEGNKDFVVTPEMRQQWLNERLERERLAKQKIEETLAILEREQAWLQYHNALTAEAVAWWGSKGIDVDVMSLLKLGWCESRTFWNGDMEFRTPTATIPVFSPGWHIKTIRHRLIKPYAECDKYRPDRAGLPASLYYANPEQEPQGQAIVIEGEIKSIVVCDRLGGYWSDNYFVVGTPGKAFRHEILKDIKDKCDRVYIVLDPDAKLQAWKLARYIGKAARVVSLGVKADDFYTLYGGTKREFEQALRYGRAT